MLTGKLGKKTLTRDRRTLKLASFLHVDELPAVPESDDWGCGITTWPMDLNDRLGCCVVAAAAHQIQAWTFASQQVLVGEEAVLKAYCDVGGYDPSDPDAAGGGLDPLAFLNYWRQVGVGGHRIGAYVEVDANQADHVAAAHYLFGGLFTGLELPRTAQGQARWEREGTLNGDAAYGSWDGHMVYSVARRPNEQDVVTWGQRLTMTDEFAAAYADCVFAVLSEDFLNQGRSPAGLDLIGLRAALRAVAT